MVFMLLKWKFRHIYQNVLLALGELRRKNPYEGDLVFNSSRAEARFVKNQEVISLSIFLFRLLKHSLETCLVDQFCDIHFDSRNTGRSLKDANEMKIQFPLPIYRQK